MVKVLDRVYKFLELVVILDNIICLKKGIGS
jgi:hypothetical protein